MYKISAPVKKKNIKYVKVVEVESDGEGDRDGNMMAGLDDDPWGWKEEKEEEERVMREKIEKEGKDKDEKELKEKEKLNAIKK